MMTNAPRRVDRGALATAALGAAVVVTAAIAMFAATAYAAPGLRLDLTTVTNEPLDSGSVQARFWERDNYKLKGALPDTFFQVRLYYWVGDTTCFGPPTNSYDTATLTTDGGGRANAHFSYPGSPPSALVGAVSGVEWAFLYTDSLGQPGRLGYRTACTTVDLR